MLKQLDTLIGFAVVMSVVSLLITIVTQTLSALLGLRGKNLADALEAMICMIAPTITSQSAKDLVMKVLTHPVISDSVLSMATCSLEEASIGNGRWQFTRSKELPGCGRKEVGLQSMAPTGVPLN